MSTIEKALGKLADKKPSRDQDDLLERSLATPREQAREAAAAPESVKTSSPSVEAIAARAGSVRPLDDSAPDLEKPGGRDRHGTQKRVVQIPLEELDSKGFLTPLKPRSSIGEEFRAIKRPLLQNCAPRGAAQLPNANLIMVTSALQGDGKTFCSLNLALSIAMEQDKTVLYVDADVLKATAGRTLGVPEETPGLIDLLTGDDFQPQDVILRTSMPKLRILPAGRRSEHATELLASDAMHQLMMELSDRYSDRVIVFDSPPLLLTTEASVLAGFMGQIVFVASSEKTPQTAVKQALEHIGEDQMVGIVMNRASRASNPFGYGYGYGYGSGYGGPAYGDAERDGASPVPGQ